MSTTVTALVAFAGFIFWAIVGLFVGIALDSAVLAAALSGVAPLAFALAFVLYVSKKRQGASTELPGRDP